MDAIQLQCLPREGRNYSRIELYTHKVERCIIICLLLSSNQSFYMFITGYKMGGANCEVAKYEGANSKHMTLVGVHSPMQLMHPNQGHATTICQYTAVLHFNFSYVTHCFMSPLTWMQLSLHILALAWLQHWILAQSTLTAKYIQ